MFEGTVGSLLRTAKWRSRLSRVATAIFALGLVSAAACTEKFEGGGACPSLCPARTNDFRDTIVDVVVLDTTVAGFPAFGLNGQLLLANRGDTLQTRAVIRYDILPTTFKPNDTGDTVGITAIDSVWIRVALDTTGTLGTQPVLLQAYDVDTTASDSVTSVVQSLFRPDRLLGSVTFTPKSAGDSLRIPLDAAKVLSKIRNGARMRVGLRLAGQAQLRFQAFVLGSGAPILYFDASTDTIYKQIPVFATTTLAGATSEGTLAYTVYPIVDRATAVTANTVLQIGGYPASRAYLRFDLPRRLIDSATIVRAELLLTQIASPNAKSTDTVYLEPLIPTSADVVTDLRRVLDLAAGGSFVGLDSTRILPAEAGPRVVNVLGLVRNWRFLPTNVPRAIGIRISREGAQPLDVRFISSEGALSSATRPRLRITYLPRAEFALP